MGSRPSGLGPMRLTPTGAFVAAGCCPPDGANPTAPRADSAAHGRQGQAVGLWGRWVGFLQPAPCGQPLSRVRRRTLVSGEEPHSTVVYVYYC